MKTPSKKNALIGYTGFVGGTILGQKKAPDFSYLYRSTNIEDIRGKSFDLVVCAGAPAQKWLANKEPEKDLASISKLIKCLENVSAKEFVLISTVDVYDNPIRATELSAIDDRNLSPYGKHRLFLERSVASIFDRYTIIRLPGLVGTGLKKNIIYDLKHSNNLDQINGANVYQFYPMYNLWKDIESAKKIRGTHNFSTEPMSAQEVASLFGVTLKCLPMTANYDMRTMILNECYMYDRKQVSAAINRYRKE